MALIPAPADERRALGVGLLGYGFMGRAHTNALRTLPYVFWPSAARPELAGIAGRTEASVREAATRFGFARYTTDWRDLVNDPAVDVFDNVGPDDQHVEPTLAAIAAGKHVMCEKPLASTAADAERLYVAAERAGVQHLTCFNYRFFPAVRLAWEMLRAGELGTIHQARFRYSQEWRTDPAVELPSGVGALDLIGCHAVDQARYLLGEIDTVTAAITSPVTGPDRLVRGVPAEPIDTVSLLAWMVDGPVTTIDASLVSPGRKNHLAWEINGSAGAVAWDLEHPNVLRVFKPGGRTAGFTEVLVTEADHALMTEWWPSAHVLGWEHGHINMWAHFLRAIAGDDTVTPHAASFRDGLQAARVAAAVHESAASGARVAVDRSEPVI
ncbi:MAG TPA: Gfo/Idh/MocA family oxidoreductase [Solirubrobacter sp.]|nr:Gfo/Idh/MocA family oxidoreductase [Solirubrobacter sp.]